MCLECSEKYGVIDLERIEPWRVDKKLKRFVNIKKTSKRDV